MFGKRKLQYEVVRECDYSEQYRDKEPMINKILLGTSLATAATVTVYGLSQTVNASTTTPTIPPTIEPLTAPTFEPLNVLATTPTIPVYSMNSMTPMTPEVIQTGYIAETSLNMLATVLDPLVQILVAISFPIASVIMVGACFFFMLGNSEKAWQTIFNAGLGYVLVQMSPLFLNILKEVGSAI